MKFQEVRKYVIIQLGVLLRRELKTLCSDSTNSLLRYNILRDKHPFCWESLVNELTAHTPIFLNILKELTHTRRPRDNRNAVIATCASILLKFRFIKMNVLQKIVSIILYAGHASRWYVVND